MGRLVRDLMNPSVVGMPGSSTIADAAKRMREGDIGDVLVIEHGRVRGVVTDRDLVVRGIAMDRDPFVATIGEVCTREVLSVSSSDDVADALWLMRDGSVRRVPVIDDGVPVGMVTLGDLAVHRDPASVLGDISAAEPNR